LPGGTEEKQKTSFRVTGLFTEIRTRDLLTAVSLINVTVVSENVIYLGGIITGPIFFSAKRIKRQDARGGKEGKKRRWVFLFFFLQFSSFCSSFFPEEWKKIRKRREKRENEEKSHTRQVCCPLTDNHSFP
jgi:hypothetical protein